MKICAFYKASSYILSYETKLLFNVNNHYMHSAETSNVTFLHPPVVMDPITNTIIALVALSCSSILAIVHFSQGSLWILIGLQWSTLFLSKEMFFYPHFTFTLNSPPNPVFNEYSFFFSLLFEHFSIQNLLYSFYFLYFFSAMIPAGPLKRASWNQHWCLYVSQVALDP